MAGFTLLHGIVPFAVFVPCWSTTCGDGLGPSCSNWFVSAHCDSQGGECCRDSFNAWCCPKHHKCKGVFDDPGGNTHCMTLSKMSGSCLCKQTDYEIDTMELGLQMSWNAVPFIKLAEIGFEVKNSFTYGR